MKKILTIGLVILTAVAFTGTANAKKKNMEPVVQANEIPYSPPVVETVPVTPKAAKGKASKYTPPPAATPEPFVASSYSSDGATPSAVKQIAGFDNGFFIGSPDGEYKLGIGGRVDAMFYYDKNNYDDPTTAANESYPATTFMLRRAQMVFQPKFKDFSGIVLVNYRTGSQTTWLANGQYNFPQGFYTKFGMDDPQYDYMSTVSSKKQSMVEAPITTTQQDGERPIWIDPATGSGWTTITRPSMGLPTQLGLFVGGSHFNDKFAWEVSVGNGIEGTDTLNQNHRFQYAGRASYAIIGTSPYDGDMTDLAYHETPSFGVGLGGAFESDPAKATVGPFIGQNMYNWSMDGAGDIAFKWRGLALSAAGYYRQLKVGPAATVEAGEKYLTDIGWQGAISYFIVPKLFEIQGFGAQIIREGPDNDTYQFGGGVNIYFIKHNAKLMLEYNRFVDFDDISGNNNRKHDRAQAKMQFYF